MALGLHGFDWADLDQMGLLVMCLGVWEVVCEISQTDHT